jgi:hypothetical protein
MQREITQRIPLLNNKGNVAQPGYARQPYWVYDRLDIRASALRIKEWDYYCVMSPDYGLAVTVADNGYMGLDSITLFDYVQKTEITKSFMQAFPMGKKKLPFSSLKGDVSIKAKDYALTFTHVGNARMLDVSVKNFNQGQPLKARIKLSDEPRDSLVIATPFEKKYHFYYNHKITGYRASGSKLPWEQPPCVSNRTNRLRCWIGDVGSGRTPTRGIGPMRPECREIGSLGSTWATGLGILQLQPKT